jgi:hypothetical protein
MTAGLPGAGIGGTFYLISALLMPVRELYRLLSGDRSAERWRLVARQTAIAAGIFAGLWLTGWAVAHLVGAAGVTARTGSSAALAGRQEIGGEAVLVPLGTLAAVLGAVQIARVAAYLRGATRTAGTGERASSARPR